ncbi:MAG: hypothetical protein HY847_06815 [Betaproteobacteria bacterium]|nr:hypothetical protein [Betaproteobacteria bacterium]
MAPSGAQHCDGNLLLKTNKVWSATDLGEAQPADLLIGVSLQIAAMLALYLFAPVCYLTVIERYVQKLDDAIQSGIRGILCTTSAAQFEKDLKSTHFRPSFLFCRGCL